MMQFWMDPLTASMNEALAGKVFECLNPDFTKGLLRYFHHSQGMMKGLPRWCMPEAYRLRDSLILDVKKWHAIAKARFRETDVDRNGGADPWWGSAFMRERQNFQKEVDNWDHDAIAASDFGVFWGQVSPSLQYSSEQGWLTITCVQSERQHPSNGHLERHRSIPGQTSAVKSPGRTHGRRVSRNNMSKIRPSRMRMDCLIPQKLPWNRPIYIQIWSLIREKAGNPIGPPKSPI